MDRKFVMTFLVPVIKVYDIQPFHYATILKNFGIEEIREILCTLQVHYVFCMHLWDVIIHI